jgi:hypothetical protein
MTPNADTGTQSGGTVESKRERAEHSCDDFVDSGEWLYPAHLRGVWEHRIGPLCGTCGWVENCHHQWHRERPVLTLGPGWWCRRCGRTAYDKDGRCTEASPPVDYPPCGTWQSMS